MNFIRPVALLSLASLAGCGGSTRRIEAPAAGSCRRFATDVEHVWNSDVSARVSARFRGEGAGVGGEVHVREAERITTGMDRASSDWVRMREQLCVDLDAGRIDRTAYNPRSACLDGWLRDLRDAVETVAREGATAADIARAFDALMQNRC